MKFLITLKDPDGVYECIRVAAEKSAKSINALSNDEREELTETRIKSLTTLCGKWFRYSEYLTVEVDTEAGTCTVVNT